MTLLRHHPFMLGVSRGRATQRPSLAQGGGQTQVKGPMGLAHSQELAPLSSGKHFPGRNPIKVMRLNMNAGQNPSRFFSITTRLFRKFK